MKMKNKKSRNTIKHSLFLVSIVFLIEAVVFVYVLMQMQSVFIGSTYIIAWVYALIKFIAGLLTLYASLE